MAGHAGTLRRARACSQATTNDMTVKPSAGVMTGSFIFEAAPSVLLVVLAVAISLVHVLGWSNVTAEEISISQTGQVCNTPEYAG